jgi:hypothetical protein
LHSIQCVTTKEPSINYAWFVRAINNSVPVATTTDGCFWRPIAWCRCVWFAPGAVGRWFVPVIELQTTTIRWRRRTPSFS